MSDVIIRPIDIERDAESLAQMWNESDLQWPGSWTEGIPITAEEVRESVLEADSLVTYVAEVDGRIVGFCSFFDGYGYASSHEGYLGLLNVHPAYQKRSIGRHLIQATIERSVQMGWKKQTLDTWAANFKSVPTYKKTGHFWKPDSEVWMENYIPGALQMPIAKPFFERHNWYECYVRTLDQCEDDERWEGMKVYTMRWQAGEESLTIWVDREAGAPMAVETDEVLVAAIASALEPLNGTETALHWRIANKREEALQVHIRALGADGLEIDHHEKFVVPPKGIVEHVANVKVTEEASRAKPYTGDAPAVRSIVTLDHIDVELYTGMRPRKPLSLDTDPSPISLIPGVPAEVALQLHNETDAEVAGTLYLTPPEGVTADVLRREVIVPAKGWLRVPIRIACAAEGAYTLAVRWVPDGGRWKAVSDALTLLAVGAGGVVTAQVGKDIRLETASLRVVVKAHGGTVTLVRKDTDEQLAYSGQMMGPPYWPPVFRNVEMNVAFEKREGRAVAHTWAESPKDAGLVMHREVALSADGLLTMRVWLENQAGQPYTRHVQIGLSPWDREKVWMALPLGGGVVYEPMSAFAGEGRDLPPAISAYEEPWLAFEYDGFTLAFAWGEGVERARMGWGMDVTSREVCLEPGQRAEAMRLALWAGRGGWREAREMALRWLGRWDPKAPLPRTRLAAEARLVPDVLTTIVPTFTARLLVDGVSRRALDGHVTLEAPAGVMLEPSSLFVRGLKRGVPVEHPVRVRLPDEPNGVWSGQARLELPLLGGAKPFHIVRLGTTREVNLHSEVREGQPVWVVENGASTFAVAPAFGPSVISWQWQGQEQLVSFFPQPQGFSWFYPWFGGIHATVIGERDGFVGYLHREHFSAQAVEVPDEAGIPWQGVRLTSRPGKEMLRDFVIELDWLTVGESPLIKLIYRVRNERPTARSLRLSVRAMFGLGGAPTDLILQGERETRQPTVWSNWRSDVFWGVLTHRETGASVALASPQPRVLLLDAGQFGRLLGLGERASVPPEGVFEMVGYLALAPTPEGARKYCALVGSLGTA